MTLSNEVMQVLRKSDSNPYEVVEVQPGVTVKYHPPRVCAGLYHMRFMHDGREVDAFIQLGGVINGTVIFGETEVSEYHVAYNLITEGLGFRTRKSRLAETLEIAVANTTKKYTNFQGVDVFGSFDDPKKIDPRDIDLVPVLEEYEGDWKFWTDDEGDHELAYDAYEVMEKFFGSHFTKFVEGTRGLFKSQRKPYGLLHIESLVAFDNPAKLKERLDHYKAKPKDFIGTEEARKRILELYQD